MLRATGVVRVTLLLVFLEFFAFGWPCEATLVIGVPNEEGMLIVSDRLGHNTMRGYSDDIEKVVVLNPNAAIAMTGSAIFSLGMRVGTNTLVKDRLDGWNLARGYFATNSLEKFNRQHFADCMSEQLSNYFVRINFKLPSSEPTGAQFIIFRTTQARECLTDVVLLMLTQTESGIKISSQCQQAVQADSVPAQILAFGNAELPLELKQGHDPRFSGLRSDPVITRFLPEPPIIKNVKLSDARAFARKLMEEAVAKTALINPHSMIGTNLDETVLRFK
jgi:hypothetical protein